MLELRQRTDDLTASLENLRTAQDRLVQTEKLASLGQLTAGIAHEIKNPLNFIVNFAELSAELASDLRDELTRSDAKPPAEVEELLCAGHPDLQGLCLALSDWSAELRIIERDVRKFAFAIRCVAAHGLCCR